MSLSMVSDDTTHPSAHIVKKEKFDPDVMKSLLQDERYAVADRIRLKKYFKHRLHTNETQVVYNYGKGYETSQQGRLYPDGGLGLQCFSRDIRNPLTAKYYWDIDIENAHYVFAQHLAEERGLKTDCMKMYIENRNACLSSVSENRSTAKTAFLRILYGGDITLYDHTLGEYVEPEGDLSFLYSLREEVNSLMDRIWLENDDVRKHCLRKRNPKASVLSIVLQTIEKHVLLTLDRFLTEKGRSMDVLIHDGGLVQRLEGETEFPQELLHEAESIILAETGYVLALINKPIVHSYDMKQEVLYIAEGVSMDTFRKKQIEFEKHHFFLRENGCICEMRIDGSLLLMVNEHAAKNMANVVFEFRKDNILKRVAFYPIWLSCGDRREYDKLVFKPDCICKENEYNTFLPLRGSSCPIATGNEGLNRFMEIALVLTKGNTSHRDYILQWIALKLQKPWIIPEVCLVFTGPQGIGKNMFWEFVGTKLIGKEQFIYTNNIMKDIFDKHSEAQMSKLFCLMDETQSSITRKMANDLKGIITAKMTQINPKDIRPFQIDTFMSYVLLTNDSTPVKLENGDRRYCVFHTGDDHKGDFAYWKETSSLFERDDVAGSVFSYLMGLELSGFVVNNFPITEIREIMLENERSLEEKFLIEISSDMKEDWRGTSQEFYKLYSEWCRKYEIRPKSAVGLGRELSPFIFKGWLGNYKNHGIHGRIIFVKRISEL
jgi:hypothetical protein